MNDSINSLRSKTLTVAIPFVGRPVQPEWALSLATVTWPLSMSVVYECIKGKEVGEARNWLVEQAKRQQSKYIWFIDDDTAPPRQSIKRLVKVLEEDPEVMVCAGIYCSKTQDNEPLVFKHSLEGAYWNWKEGDVFDCRGIGTGCMLIRMSVFDHLEKPYFKTIDSEDFLQTDDIYFCDKVIAAGYKVKAHGGVLPIHWGADGTPYWLPKGSYPISETKDYPLEQYAVK